MSVIFSKYKLPAFSQKKTIANIMSLIGVFMFSVMGVIFADSYRIYFLQNKENLYGKQDLIVSLDNRSDIFSVINNYKLTSYGVIISYGNFKIKNKDITIGVCDKNSIDINRLFALEGHMPKKDDEIIIESSWLTSHGCVYNIGDTINIVSDQGENLNFTVCGILRDYSNFEWNNNENNSKIPNAFVCQQAIQCVPIKEFFVSIVCAEKAAIENISCSYNTIRNQLVLESSSVYKNCFYNQMLIYVVETALEMIISITSWILFGTLTYDRWGMKLLKKPEFTKKKIYLYSFAQNVCVLVFSILLGTIAAILISLFLIKIINHFINLYFNWKTIAFLDFSIFITHMAILSYKFHKDYTCTTSSENDHLYNCSDYKNILKNKAHMLRIFNALSGVHSRNMITIITLLVIFISVSIYISNYSNYLFEKGTKADIEIQIYNPRFYEPIEINADIYAGMKEIDFESLKKLDIVSEIAGVKRMEVFSIEENSYSQSYHGASSPEDFEASKEKYGYKNFDLSKHVIKGIDDNMINNLNDFLVAGTINLDKLRSGEEIVVVENKDGLNDKAVGEKVAFSKVIVNKAGEVERVDFQTTIGAIVNCCDSVSLSSIEREIFDNCYIWSDSAFDKIGLSLNYIQVYINIRNESDLNEINTYIYPLQNKYSNYYFLIMQNLSESISKRELLQTFTNVIQCELFVLVSYVFYYIFVLILCEVNMKVNTYQIRVFYKEDNNEVCKIIVYQNMVTVLYSIILGIISSLIVCVLADISLGHFMASFYPLLDIILVMIALSFTVLIITILTIRWIHIKK